MKKIAVAAAVAGALCGCSVTREVEVYEPVRLTENQKVCVVRNEKLEKRGYLDIVMDSAARHGLAPIAVESMKTKRCPFYLTYAVKYKRDFKEFISSAKLNLYKGKNHVSSGKYVLDGSYMNLSWGEKYETAETVMDMMFDDLMAKLAETAPQDYYEPEKTTAEGQPVATTEETLPADQPAEVDETNLNPEEAATAEGQQTPQEATTATDGEAGTSGEGAVTETPAQDTAPAVESEAGASGAGPAPDEPVTEPTTTPAEAQPTPQDAAPAPETESKSVTAGEEVAPQTTETPAEKSVPETENKPATEAKPQPETPQAKDDGSTLTPDEAKAPADGANP